MGKGKRKKEKRKKGKGKVNRGQRTGKRERETGNSL